MSSAIIISSLLDKERLKLYNSFMNIPTYPYVCPFCDNKLLLSSKSYVCSNAHLFDVSKFGYVNLLPVNKKNSLDPGDNKEMIKARGVVMDNGYYKSLADSIIEIIKPYNIKSILDAGCGIGYLTHRLQLSYPKTMILGTDISKFAIIHASKKYKSIPFAVASSNSLPIKTSSIDALICAFAPVFSEEFLRVLSKGGIFIRVIPSEKHLFNLKALLYDTPNENETDKTQIDGFTFIKSIIVNDTFNAKSSDELLSLVQMTPYFYHAKKSAIEEISNIPSLLVNQEFEVRLYVKD
jgi:23S rRNA (guanine745-N1)-methyltransferase